MRASILIRVLLPALVLALSACGGSETRPTPTRTSNPAPTRNQGAAATVPANQTATLAPTLTQETTPTTTPTPTPTVTPTPTPIPVAKADEHYTAAVSLYEQDRLEDAIAEYDEAIHLNPQFAKAYERRGAAYFRLGQYQGVIEDFDEAIRLNPQFAKAYRNRGIAYGRLGQYQRAIQDYDEAIQLDPGDVHAYWGRGFAYHELEQYQSAIQDYDEAIHLDPEEAILYGNRGLAYYQLEQYQSAIEDFDEAIRLNPQFATAYSNRGDAYSFLGQYLRAIEDYEEAIRLDPEDVNARGGRVSVSNLLIRGKYAGKYVVKQGYALTSRQNSWLGAEAEAVAVGGHLVTINDREEQELLVRLFFSPTGGPLFARDERFRTYWIGLSNPDSGGRWEWASGAPLTYTNWHRGEPNNFLGDEAYVAINWHWPCGRTTVVGTWNDTALGGLHCFGIGDAPLYGIIELPRFSSPP